MLLPFILLLVAPLTNVSIRNNMEKAELSRGNKSWIFKRMKNTWILKLEFLVKVV